MRYSSLVRRLDGPGAQAWAIHDAAVQAKRAGRADVIFASVGYPDRHPPARGGARAGAALRAGDTHYSEGAGRDPLRAAIAAQLSSASGVRIGPDNVVVVAGAQNALFAASLCLLEAGDELVVPEPTYVTYEATFGLTGAKLVRVGMSADSGFRPDARALARAVTPHTLALTGWRVGWIVGPEDFARHVGHLALNMLYGLPGFIQEAAVAGFAHHGAVTADMRAHYRARRDLVAAELREIPGLHVLVPEAGMFVLLDTRDTGRPPLDLAWAIFHETGVSLLDASAFGAAAHGFLRMSFGLGEADLREACRRIRGFFERLAGNRMESDRLRSRL